MSTTLPLGSGRERPPPGGGDPPSRSFFNSINCPDIRNCTILIAIFLWLIIIFGSLIGIDCIADQNSSLSQNTSLQCEIAGFYGIAEGIALVGTGSISVLLGMRSIFRRLQEIIRSCLQRLRGTLSGYQNVRALSPINPLLPERNLCFLLIGLFVFFLGAGFLYSGIVCTTTTPHSSSPALNRNPHCIAVSILEIIAALLNLIANAVLSYAPLNTYPRQRTDIHQRTSSQLEMNALPSLRNQNPADEAENSSDESDHESFL